MRALPSNFGWLIEGRLAGCAYPGGAGALAALQSCGVRALVSLSEEALPGQHLQAAGLACVHLAVADFTAPTLDQIRAAVAAIDGFLARGRPVAVHCAAGLGRTGTILACYLVHQGATAPDAIAAVRVRRPGSVETPEQEAAVRYYARHLRPARA